MDDDHDCDCPPEGAPPWMATFSDMATLMLCFFVLLLSFANMDVQNFRTALGSVKEAFGVQFRVRGNFEALATSPVELSPVQSAATLHETKAVDSESLAIVEEFIRSRGLEDSLEVEGDARGVIVRVKDRVLFDSGEARLKDEGVPVLLAVGELFEHFTGTLSIEGHTDDRPIRTFQFPSNWELSGARSASVLRYLATEGIDPQLVHIAGYSFLRPVASNATEEGRAQNRRVEFVFEYDDEFGADPAAAYDVERLRLENEDLFEDRVGDGTEQGTNGALPAEPAPEPVETEQDGGALDGGLGR